LALQRKNLPEKELTPDEVLAKVEYYCAYQERCPKEVRNKIREYGIEGEDAEQIYHVLEGDGFVNEERYALAYAGGKFRINEWGKVRIQLELKSRGIATQYIQAALDAIDADAYEATFQKLLERKQAELERDGKKDIKQKLIAYLLRVGFEPGMVFGGVLD
jgi:regulatory protein